MMTTMRIFAVIVLSLSAVLGISTSGHAAPATCWSPTAISNAAISNAVPACEQP